MKIHQLTTCPGCASVNHNEFLLGDHPLRRCSDCDMVFAPEYADPDDIYVEGYLTAATDFGLEHIQHPLFQALLDGCAQRRFEILEKVTGGPGSFLDVGCGSGEMLRGATKRGWSATGVEPVEESVAIARSRGLDVTCGLLQDSGLPERGYDVVGAFHVLEHIPDGQSFLRLLARWARPGGYVFIEVPNYRSFHRRNTGGNWPGLRPLEHIGHYTPATLASTMRRAGLDPVTVRTTNYLFRESPTKYAVADLAQWRLMKPLQRLSKERPYKDGPERFPGATAWGLLSLIAGAYDVGKVGHALLGVARVP